MMTIIDSGGANLSSVLFAFERMGVKARLSTDPDVIYASPKLILPGVGAARAVMNNLAQIELLACLRELKQPVLGICLGMQILFESSEEGDVTTLGFIPGRVSKMNPGGAYTVPHMGWNRVRSLAPSVLLPVQDEAEHFYFVHSYAAPEGAAVRAVADYGGPVPAIVEWKNWFGVQFHPERSGPAGQRLLQRFVEM